MAEICKEKVNEEIEIIVPDKLSLFMEKFLFEKMQICASFNIKVSTLNRFAKKNITISKEKQISNNGSILLVNKILNENFDKLKTLKNHRYSFAYAESIYATISQLKASRITPQEMLKFKSLDVRLMEKIHDLALIFEDYENRKAGLLDVSDVFMLSVLSVAEGKENSNLYFVGFDDFTAIEYAIIERLAFVANVNVFNYFSTKSNSRIYNSEVYSQLKNIAFVNKLKFEVETPNENVSDTKQFLQNNLFGFDKTKFELQNEIVKIYEANSVEEEIEFVARDIKNKIINGNNFSDFGVAIFDPENKYSKIKEIFEKYEINYYIDSNLTLNNSIFYKFLISIFKFNINPQNISSLFDIINSPFFILDNRKKINLINKLMFFKCVGNNFSNFDLGEDLNESKDKLSKFLQNFKLEKSLTVLQIKQVFETAFDVLCFDEIVNKIVEENSDLQNKILLTKSKEMLLNLFDEIQQFYVDADLQTVYDIFVRIANVVKVNNLPLALDSVKVVDANNMMEIFNNLYLIDCTNSNVPSLKQDCGIILDSEIEKLNFSFKLSPTIAHINKLSRLRLFNTLLLFEKSLNITYSHLPSEVINDLFSKLTIKIGDEVIDLCPIPKLNQGKYEALSEWDYIEFLCKHDKENKKLFEKLIKNKQFDSISLKNLKIYENMKTISASQLENFFKCPFYAFLNDRLKIYARIDNDVLALDVGNILHEIMYEYYRQEKNVGDIQEFCKQQVLKLVEQNERLKVNEKSPILINLIDEATRVISGVNYIDSNTLFQTNKNMLEVEFSNKTALKLRNIDLIGKIDRIDIFEDVARIIDYKSGRADATLKELYYGNKLQLFLYSSACEKWLKKNVVGEFYLPLHNNYEAEIGNAYKLKGFFVNDEQIVQALDTKLLPGEKSDIVNMRMTKANKAAKTRGYKELTSAEMCWLKNYAKEISEVAVDEIKSGFIKPTPSAVSEHCKYCFYKHICMQESSNIKYRETQKIVPESFKRGEEWKNLKECSLKF